MFEDTDIPSLSELQKEREPTANAFAIHQSQLTPVERFADWITNKVGSMGFFFILLLWTVSWLAWNTFAPEESRFDPFPAFVLWLFISNMLQLLLLPLIMIGQNLEQRFANIRSQADFEVNRKAEREVEAILQHLERQDGMLQDIKNRLTQLEEKHSKKA